MGVKLREGFFRRVENNIMINGYGGFHVWYDNSGDVIRRNIVINKNPWQFIKGEPECAREIDYGLFFWEEGEPEITGLGDPISFQEWQKRGFDTHSLLGDLLFVDPDNYDCRVKTGSPALDVGFENFRMDNFGVYNPRFIAEAAKVERIFATPETIRSWEEYTRSDGLQKWLGGEVKNLKGEGERSDWGMGENTGVIVKKVPKGSILEKIGFRENDLVLKIEDHKIHTVEDLIEQSQRYNKPVQVYIKNRGMVTIKLNLVEK